MLVAKLACRLFFFFKFGFLVVGDTLVVFVEISNGLDLAACVVQLLLNGLELTGQCRLGIIDDLFHHRVIGVQCQVVGCGHVAIEVHARLELGHLLHAAHVLALRDDDRLIVGVKRCIGHIEFTLIESRNLRLKQSRGDIFLLIGEFRLLGIFFFDKIVEHIGIDAHKSRLLVFLFKHAHKWSVELSIHHQHVVALVGSRLDKGVLTLLVGSIKVNEIAVFVGLVSLDKFLVVIELVILATNVFKQGKLHCAVAELLIAQHAILNKNFNVSPFFLKVFSIFA